MTETLSPDIAAQLDQLRDIHMPQPVGWWPLAPGWWIALALICVLVLGTMIWRTLSKYTARHIALRELEKLDCSDTRRFAIGLSILLRRVAMRRDRSAGQLKGADWSAYLGHHGMDPEFATLLAQAPYARVMDESPDIYRLRQEASQWIRRQT